MAAEQQLEAAISKAASDTVRWREEVALKQARIDMLVAGDRAREADFMGQRVKELQVLPLTVLPCPALPCLLPCTFCPVLPCLVSSHLALPRPALLCPALPCSAM